MVMIFITGITGLVGSFIAHELIQKGETLRALKRKESDLSLVSDIQHLIDWIEGDLLDDELLSKALEGVEYVIHAAAIVSFDPNDISRLFTTNVEGTANLINECLRKKESIKKFCHISSIAAIGKDGQKVISEDTKWKNSEDNSYYAKSKYLAETEVWRGSEEGLNVVVVNPTIILGVGDWTRSSAKLFQQVWNLSRYYPKGILHYVDVRDVAQASVKLLFSDIVEERFILNGGTSTYHDFYEKVAKAFGKQSPSVKVPHWIFSLIWRFERIRSVFFTNHKPLVTKETTRALKREYTYKSDKIKKTLNYQFYTLQESIEWTCKGLVERYNLQKVPKK
ncbi:MAG: NAD-dependent epimerase/dehydratase family protein [Cytophagales bacterium]|nr:NAD-dependent epimerase/dehydratase family protein [Cytophagales bacterium]